MHMLVSSFCDVKSDGQTGRQTVVAGSDGRGGGSGFKGDEEELLLDDPTHGTACECRGEGRDEGGGGGGGIAPRSSR